jgi:hypothetical protein
LVKQEILYSQDPIWNDPALPLFDPHTIAWVNRDDLAQILPKLSGQPPVKSELVTVRYPDPQHVVLEAMLESPGLVILSDVFYPGWRLTIDDQAAPIYPVNVAMRGALVPAGHHRLVYSFEPRSFYVGLIVSILGLCVWVLLGFFCLRGWHSTPLSISLGQHRRGTRGYAFLVRHPDYVAYSPNDDEMIVYDDDDMHLVDMLIVEVLEPVPASAKAGPEGNGT